MLNVTSSSTKSEASAVIYLSVQVIMPKKTPLIDFQPKKKDSKLTLSFRLSRRTTRGIRKRASGGVSGPCWLCRRRCHLHVRAKPFRRGTTWCCVSFLPQTCPCLSCQPDGFCNSLQRRSSNSRRWLLHCKYRRRCTKCTQRAHWDVRPSVNWSEDVCRGWSHFIADITARHERTQHTIIHLGTALSTL